MRIVQWGYKIPFVTLPPLRLQGQETTYPKGSLSGRLWASQCKSCDRASSTLPGFYSRLFLVRKATGEWRPIIRSVLPQCLRALPELHYGDTSVNLQGPSTGPVVNLPVTTAPLGSSQYCHSGCQPVWEYFQNTQTCTSNCPPSSGKNCSCT